ncbi:M10 family metallopeptidase [Anabaena azotica]|uniref:M10 family metallopeptidase C-terminal domain-containing protein n=1 Tax=Anabaena azotica FACHB-119 TaxID=947527 RepID=A0ABR8DAZ4_9NOST|nr:M10 family metallopeptidase [Anabaena azotica]MBD2503726.1 M10 family metallopeptidase C-terminal domain-containing protein [Anabaena azotica FACHB-119]
MPYKLLKTLLQEQTLTDVTSRVENYLYNEQKPLLTDGSADVETFVPITLRQSRNSSRPGVTLPSDINISAGLISSGNANLLTKSDSFGIPTPATTVSATYDNNIDGLLSGVKWSSTSISFSFTDSINDYELGYTDRASHAISFQKLNLTQQAVARRWIGSGGEFYNISLLSPFELTGTSDRDATIRMAMSSVPNTAFAYYPNSSYVEGGDAWFNPNSYNNPVIGNYAYHTFGHELGHALGLKHGQELGGVRNVAMNSDRDSMEFSIMTYRSYVGHDLNALPYYTNETWGYAQSLMMYDIRAIQQMYGAWFGYNSTNTTYTFSTTTGEMFINGVGQGTPGANRIFRTIWDGNGIDTYDFSNYTTNLSINLTPGGWTDLDVGGNFQRAMLNAGYGGITRYARGHVFNALQYNGDVRSLIENANGGSGNDTIIGNIANNVLNGNGGNDTINGGAGADTTNGGSGNDRIIDDDAVSFDIHDGGDGIDTIDYSQITFASGVVTINLATSTTSVTGGNTETIRNFENVEGSQGGETIIGNSANNVLNGNGGNDIIDGGAGNDTINGGAGVDTTNGGLGNDRIIDDDAVSFDIHDGGDGTDTIDYSKVTFASGVVTINLATSTTSVTGGNTETIRNFENVEGSQGGETIIGNSANNILNGNGGDDTINAGAGVDTTNGGSGSDRIIDNDFVNFDIHDGGSGTDTIDYSQVTFGSGVVTINLATSTTSVAVTGGNTETIRNFENVEGSQGGETIIGSSGNNLLKGNGGNDLINGGAGNDTLIGGDGNDSLVGGTGKDTLTGGSGFDKFIYNALNESLLASYDVITDYVSGEQIDAISSIFAVTLNSSVGNAASLSASAISTVLTTGVFTANSAKAFTVTGMNGTFIALNNSVSGFDSVNDSILFLQNYTLGSVSIV